MSNEGPALHCPLLHGWRDHKTHKNALDRPACGAKGDFTTLEFTDERPTPPDMCGRCSTKEERK